MNIKFRIWDGQRYHCNNDNYVIGLDGTVYNILDGIEVVKDIVIERFTGVLDQNNKEVYEGDIVKFADWKPKTISWAGGDNTAGFIYQNTLCFLMGYDSPQLLVIGNIHQNPELLN